MIGMMWYVFWAKSTLKKRGFWESGNCLPHGAFFLDGWRWKFESRPTSGGFSKPNKKYSFSVLGDAKIRSVEARNIKMESFAERALQPRQYSRILFGEEFGDILKNKKLYGIQVRKLHNH